MDGLTKDDSSVIAFVVACFFAGAIDTPQLNEWAERIKVSSAHYPNYIVDLREFVDPAKSHIYRSIGFVPSEGPTDLERIALSGIARLLGNNPLDAPPADEAASALRQCPSIMAAFKQHFPSIDVPSF
jgi:hypothetical protein